MLSQNIIKSGLSYTKTDMCDRNGEHKSDYQNSVTQSHPKVGQKIPHH